jgi:hypothetical protein
MTRPLGERTVWQAVPPMQGGQAGRSPRGKRRTGECRGEAQVVG